MNFDMPMILLFVFALVVGVFLTIGWACAQLGGWSALAAHYRTRAPFAGKRWRMQSITMHGWVGYNGGVTVGANADGLYLAMPMLVGHPPLFIPWTDLSLLRRD